MNRKIAVRNVIDCFLSLKWHRWTKMWIKYKLYDISSKFIYLFLFFVSRDVVFWLNHFPFQSITHTTDFNNWFAHLPIYHSTSDLSLDLPTISNDNEYTPPDLPVILSHSPDSTHPSFLEEPLGSIKLHLIFLYSIVTIGLWCQVPSNMFRWWWNGLSA